jgi:hypothetical protein
MLVTILAGHVIVGGSVSLMVTLKLQVAVLPLRSVTSKVLTVVPMGKAAPLGSPVVCFSTAPKGVKVTV